MERYFLYDIYLLIQPDQASSILKIANSTFLQDTHCHVTANFRYLRFQVIHPHLEFLPRSYLHSLINLLRPRFTVHSFYHIDFSSQDLLQQYVQLQIRKIILLQNLWCVMNLNLRFHYLRLLRDDRELIYHWSGLGICRLYSRANQTFTRFLGWEFELLHC